MIESLMYDIENIAEEKFTEHEFKKFAIKIKLVPIKKYREQTHY
jgi:hypothetical protein